MTASLFDEGAAPSRAGAPLAVRMRPRTLDEVEGQGHQIVGSEVEVVVLEIDPSGRRIRLSAKAVMEAREAEEVREWTERNAPPAEGLGTLADFEAFGVVRGPDLHLGHAAG